MLINAPGLCNVQNVLGMRLLAAKRTLARINCRVGKVRYAFSKRAKKGLVISQNPLFGAMRPRGTKVTLVVSRGRRHKSRALRVRRTRIELHPILDFACLSG